MSKSWLLEALEKHGVIEKAVSNAARKLSSRRKPVIKAQTEFAGRFGNDAKPERIIHKSELTAYVGRFGDLEKARRESAQPQSTPTSIFDEGLLR